MYDDDLTSDLIRQSFSRALSCVTFGVSLTEGGARHRGHAIYKLGLEKDIGVGEHAVLERDHHKLLKECLNV